MNTHSRDVMCRIESCIFSSIATLILFTVIGCRPGVTAPATPVVPKSIVLITVEGGRAPGETGGSILGEALGGGISFDDMMTPCPQVRPAVAAALTGQAPDRTGVRDNATTPLPESFPIVSKLLLDRGWATAGFVANPLVGFGSGLDRGFELFDAPREFAVGPAQRFPKVRKADEVVSNFLTWRAQAPKDRAHFAWIHLAGRTALGETPDGKETEAASSTVAAAVRKIVEGIEKSDRKEASAIFVVGTSGPLDPDQGESSGYFLTPSVLRVPFCIKAAVGSHTGLDKGAPLWLPDVAAMILKEASVPGALPDGMVPSGGQGPSRTRFAWTWSGNREFGWPPEAAVIRGGVMVSRDGPAGSIGSVEWREGTPIIGREDPGDLLAQLAPRAGWAGASGQKPPALPAELREALAKIHFEVPASMPDRSEIARSTRIAVVPLITQARRLALKRNAALAIKAFDEAARKDPGNHGVRAEAGELLAMEKAPERARAKLEEALRLHPYEPTACHWLGHVAFDEKEIAKAEALWRLADFLTPNSADLLYDLACSRSLQGDAPGSLAYLQRAWAAGFRVVNTIQSDPDLRTLRADPRFARFMQEVVR